MRPICFLFAVLCLLSGGCLGLGYKAGAKPLFGEDIQTIYVPMFESDPTRRHIAERLTEAVCKRIEERSPYKVVNRPAADSTLVGQIISKDQKVSIVDHFNDPRQKSNTLKVQIKWKNRRDQELRSAILSWNEGSASATGSDDMVAEYGHSLLTSDQKQIDEVVDQIVGMMEVPW